MYGIYMLTLGVYIDGKCYHILAYMGPMGFYWLMEFMESWIGNLVTIPKIFTSTTVQPWTVVVDPSAFATGSGGRRCSHKFQRSVTNTLPCWRSSRSGSGLLERSTMIGHVFVSPSSRLIRRSNVMPCFSKFDVFYFTNSGFSKYVNSLEGDRILEWQLAAHWSHYSPGMGQTCHPKSAKIVGRYGPLVPQWLNPRSQVSNTYPTWSINIILWLWNFYIKILQNYYHLSP